MLPPDAVEPREPQPQRFYINDATPEALANILVGNPQGVVSVADELSSFLNSFERYSNNSEGFWLAAYNGDPHTIDRKGSGCCLIRRLSRSVEHQGPVEG